MSRLVCRSLALVVAVAQAACNDDILLPIPVAEIDTDVPGRPKPKPHARPEPETGCEPGTTTSCYEAAAETRNIGECRDGVRRCGSDRRWGACEGGVGPGAEVCDGLDNDCDRDVDEGLGDDVTACGLGQCAHTVTACEGGATPQCDPMQGATKEVCDGLDNDCDGLVDEDLGATTCGFGPCRHTVPNCVAGRPMTCDPLQGATAEICDGEDNDCDNSVDEDLGDVFSLCGVGECAHQVSACDNGEVPVCDPMRGASVEVCDGLDNDCDGLADEDLGTTTCGTSVCRHTVRNCVDGQPVTCDPFLGATLEICDGIDNDCDGDVDELLGDVMVYCGVGECAHGVTACTDGTTPSCDPLEGALPEVCDGRDNDCDGDTDEGLGSTSCGLGACAHTVPNCTAGQPQICDPFAGASDEACDGIDNDCDGEVDEGLPLLSCGIGVCAQVMASCVAGQPQVCDPMAGASPELCDGLDNDCDGAIDEGLGTTACGLGVCAQAVDNCVGGQPQVCDPLAGAAPEICDGLDNDCDGLIDEDLGDMVCGLGVCQRVLANCVNGQPVACDPLAGASPEICDGLDNDCDGAVDEDFSDDELECGLGQCAHSVSACVDGVPAQCDPMQGASSEICDGEDNDCDGAIDEGLGTWTCGVGPCLTEVPRCVDGVPQPEQSCDPRNGELEICGDGVDNDCDGTAPPCRDDYTTGTSSSRRPVDVVWAIDSSGSMSVEMATAESNVNDFADALTSAVQASALHLIADRGTGSFEICVDPPLGRPACNDNPPGFYQYDTNGGRNGDEMVHSSNALGRIMQQFYAWGPRLQSGSHVAFVITTDDDGDDVLWRAPNDASELNDCTSTAAIVDSTDEDHCRWIDPSTGAVFTSLAYDFSGLYGFTTFMALKFPNAVPGKDWTVYPIIGATGDHGLDPSLQFACSSAVEPGNEYVKLAQLTGTEDAMIPICDASWDLVGLASAIVNNVPQDTFVLQGGVNCAAIDPATLVVRVNGVALAPGDWIYDPATCELRITTNVPNIGDPVQVEYELF